MHTLSMFYSSFDFLCKFQTFYLLFRVFIYSQYSFMSFILLMILHMILGDLSWSYSRFFWDSFKLSLKLLEPGNVCVEGAAVILIIIIITNTNRISNNIYFQFFVANTKRKEKYSHFLYFKT